MPILMLVSVPETAFENGILSYLSNAHIRLLEVVLNRICRKLSDVSMYDITLGPATIYYYQFLVAISHTRYLRRLVPAIPL